MDKRFKKYAEKKPRRKSRTFLFHYFMLFCNFYIYIVWKKVYRFEKSRKVTPSVGIFWFVEQWTNVPSSFRHNWFPLVQLLKELELDPIYGLNTHVHADHVTGTHALKQVNQSDKKSESWHASEQIIGQNEWYMNLNYQELHCIMEFGQNIEI